MTGVSSELVWRQEHNRATRSAQCPPQAIQRAAITVSLDLCRANKAAYQGGIFSAVLSPALSLLAIRTLASSRAGLPEHPQRRPHVTFAGISRGIPLCLRRLGLRCSDETEVIGDQRRELLTEIVKVAEEPIDRRLESGKGRIVLIPQCGLFEKPPQPLDQV
jgi:hypothetical protein